MELLRDGVVTRGVLLDVARARGVAWLGPGEGVLPEDLEAAERASGVRLEPGDILLVRTGYYARRIAEGPVNPAVAGSPGPHAALAPWLRERGVAMFGSDTHNDVVPTPYPGMGHPFHVVSLVALGLWLIDNMNLEDLARACAERKRWEFMLTIARTLMGNPELLLLDEPSEGLAPLVVDHLRDQIGRLKRDGLTILLAEQNVEFSLALGDRVYVLEKGSIRFAGAAADLRDNESLRHELLAL